MKWFYITAFLITAALVLAPLYWLRAEQEDYGKLFDKEPVVRWDSYGAAVKSIDPATCGDTTSSSFQGNVYEGLLTYHFLKRPPEVIPQLAAEMPEVSDDLLTYTFKLKKDAFYHRNPCFGPDESDEHDWSTRAIEAKDFVLAFKRIADPQVISPLAWSLISGKIEEANETNNLLERVIELGEPVVVELIPRDKVLEIEKIVLKREEYPLIPMIFFNENRSLIDSSDAHKLDIIAERLNDNKAAVLKIKGFYNPDSETKDKEGGKQLAIRRAKAVKDYISERYEYLSNRVELISTEEYNPAQKWVEGSSSNEYQAEVANENQRAELLAEFDEPDYAKPLFTAKTPVALDQLPDFKTIKDLMWMNPDIRIIVEGHYATNKSKDDVINETIEIQDKLYHLFKKKAGFIIRSDTADYIQICLTPEGITNFPIKGDEYVYDYRIKDIKDNTFDITVKNFGVIDSFELGIVRDKKVLIKMLERGKGAPPEEVDWDWKDNFANLAQPDHKYYLGLNVYQGGWKKTFFSEPVQVEITETKKLIEELIMVLYEFDKTNSRSKILETRMASLVDFIMSKIVPKEPQTVEIKLIGHTDEIGTPERNQELSEARAAKELDLLEDILMLKFGKTSRTELHTFLNANAVKLSAEGHAASEPFRVGRTGELIGDNDTPSGRNVNRRVMIQIIRYGD